MIKLKFNLDPADKNQMLALSRFAGTLAGAGVEIQTNKPEGIKLAAVTAEAGDVQSPSGLSVRPESPQPPTRKRRTKAELEAERLAAMAEEAPDEDPEAENEEAEEVEEAEEDPKNDVKSTAERGGKKITMDDVRAAVADKKDKHFDKMKRELLNRYGVATTPKLPEEHWAAFYDFVNGLD